MSARREGATSLRSRRSTALGAVALTAAGALTLASVRLASADDYTVVFGGTTTLAGSLTLGSPHGGTIYRDVTSKFNQPRLATAIGSTNPHRGTDLASSFGTAIYSPWKGWIVEGRPCGVDQILTSKCELDVYLDLNNDGLKNDNAHMRFDHMSHLRYTVRDTPIAKGEWLGDSGTENGVVPAHLHFGLRKDLNADGIADVWIRNEPYYRGVTTPWDSGRRLDFVSLSTFSSNVAAVYCYAADETNQDEQVAAGDVVIFHRRAGTSTWSATTASKAGNQFSVNMTGRYAAGTSINWMARCVRTSKKTTILPYWAFHTPKFNQPSADPNSTANAYDFFVNTVQ